MFSVFRCLWRSIQECISGMARLMKGGRDVHCMVPKMQQVVRREAVESNGAWAERVGTLLPTHPCSRLCVKAPGLRLSWRWTRLEKPERGMDQVWLAGMREYTCVQRFARHDADFQIVRTRPIQSSSDPSLRYSLVGEPRGTPEVLNYCLESRDC